MKKLKGFTLIEAVVYMALLGLIMSGAVETAYQLVQSSSGLAAKNTAGEEGNFVLHKLDWALSGTQTVSAPTGWGSALAFTKYDGTTVDVCFKNNAVWMRENKTGGACADHSYTAITTGNVVVHSLGFQYSAATGGAPAGVEASTTINNLVFYTTRYIRK